MLWTTRALLLKTAFIFLENLCQLSCTIVNFTELVIYTYNMHIILLHFSSWNTFFSSFSINCIISHDILYYVLYNTNYTPQTILLYFYQTVFVILPYSIILFSTYAPCTMVQYVPKFIQLRTVLYVIGEWAYGKRRVSKEIFSCDHPMLAELPPNLGKINFKIQNGKVK